MKLDAAVVKLLDLESAEVTVSSFGHGTSSASTNKITVKQDGSEKRFFMKVLKGEDGPLLMEGEHESLQAISAAVPNLCPRSFGFGTFQSSPATHFLVADFLEFSSSQPKVSLAKKLAKLHSTPAPIPEGYSTAQFGFPVTTCCGDTPQDNSFKSSWAEFFAENRLRFILRRCERNQGRNGELRKLVEATADAVVPRLLGPHINGGRELTPVVVHGDLWSGNVGRASIGGGPVEDVIYDPSAFYAHSEYELGIMRMFGGFGSFYAEYHELCAKTEPVDEYDDRVSLYELYHHLNHYAIFGGGYKGGAIRIMKALLQKYGPAA